MDRSRGELTRTWVRLLFAGAALGGSVRRMSDWREWLLVALVSFRSRRCGALGGHSSELVRSSG